MRGPHYGIRSLGFSSLAAISFVSPPVSARIIFSTSIGHKSLNIRSTRPERPHHVE